jgi:tetratricopeptide (TPR) repeat protein
MSRFLRIASVFLFCASALAARQAQDSTTQKLINEGDEFTTKQFENQKALDVLQKALAASPNNYEVLWRISRSYVDIGEHQPAKSDDEKKSQLETYEKALDFANKAVAANANGTMGYTRRAIASGRIALFRGVWESLDIVKKTKADIEKAIQLDANNPGAYYVLGRTHAKVSEKPRIVRWPLGLSWASTEEAIKNYEKAISLRPGFLMYRLDAARAYVEADNYSKAKEHLTAAISASKQDEDDDRFRKEAQELMEEIKDK